MNGVLVWIFGWKVEFIGLDYKKVYEMLQGCHFLYQYQWYSKIKQRQKSS
jgi:hypothetical protein